MGGGADRTAGAIVDAADNILITGTVYNGLNLNDDYFTIKYNAFPKITEVSPLYIGEVSNVSIKGNGFLADSEVSFSDAGISTGTMSFIPPDQINLSVDVSASVILGITTVTLTNTNGESVVNESLASTRLRKTVTVGESQTLSAQTKTGAVSVDIPAGAFDQQETAVIYAFEPALGDTRQIGEGLYFEVSPPAVPSKNIAVKLPYKLSAIGSYPETALNVAYYDATEGWVNLTSSVNTSQKTVTGVGAKANCKFAIVKAGSSGDITILPGGFGEAKVYPNPYMHGSGGYFDQSSMGDGIVFADFNPAESFKLTIVNIAGQLVFSESCIADNSGKFLWDTKTASGEVAASGVYIYAIEGSGDSRKGKFSIIR